MFYPDSKAETQNQQVKNMGVNSRVIKEAKNKLNLACKIQEKNKKLTGAKINSGDALIFKTYVITASH